MSTSSILHEIANIQEKMMESLKNSGNILLTPEQTFTLVDVAKNEWNNFTQEWENLMLDTYMADGGKYRLRRYSSYDYDHHKKTLNILPHEAYIQSYTINSLNGGVRRIFSPCTTTFLASPVLQNLLMRLGETFSQLTSVSQWNIKLHPYRILASMGANGKPAPEGRHRDGVTYIMTMMIKRHNVSGGVSAIYNAAGEQIFHHTLENLGEMLLGDDIATMHSVTPIEPLDKAGGYRDVLVIAFTRNT